MLTMNRYHPVDTLRQNSIPCMIWGEDALRQFGCRIIVGDLFLIVDDPTTAARCLHACGEYKETFSDIAYSDGGLLAAAPRLIHHEDDNLCVALLRASNWPHLPPLVLSPEPLFPPLAVLLASLLGTWLQQPYSEFSVFVATWISCVYAARADPALTLAPPQDAYLALARAIPVRLRQFHVDLVHERVFMLANSAHSHYSAVAKAVDERTAGRSVDADDVPLPSAGEVGKGRMANFWKPTTHDKRALG